MPEYDTSHGLNPDEERKLERRIRVGRLALSSISAVALAGGIVLYSFLRDEMIPGMLPPEKEKDIYTFQATEIINPGEEDQHSIERFLLEGIIKDIKFFKNGKERFPYPVTEVYIDSNEIYHILDDGKRESYNSDLTNLFSFIDDEAVRVNSEWRIGDKLHWIEFRSTYSRDNKVCVGREEMVKRAVSKEH